MTTLSHIFPDATTPLWNKYSIITVHTTLLHLGRCGMKSAPRYWTPFLLSFLHSLKQLYSLLLCSPLSAICTHPVMWHVLHKLVQTAILLVCIWEVPGSILVRTVAFPIEVYHVLPHLLQANFNYTMTNSFHILSSSSFIIHPTKYYIVCYTDTHHKITIN
jgi:hypothetical protein